MMMTTGMLGWGWDGGEGEGGFENVMGVGSWLVGTGTGMGMGMWLGIGMTEMGVGYKDIGI